MSGRVKFTNSSVLQAGLERFRRLYRDGHRVIVTVSGGKDSTVSLEMAILAATMENRLPVEVIHRDDELDLPSTFEYLSWLAEERDEIKFYWVTDGHANANICNRESPYFWPYDKMLPASKWMRLPPSYAWNLETKTIDHMILPGRFPPEPGKDLINVQGIRTQESQTRRLAIYSANSFLTKVKPETNVRAAYPLYDWREKDIWTFMQQQKIRYNKAYDYMVSLNVKPSYRRVGPITMNSGSIHALTWAPKVWPLWAEKMYERCPGTRAVARYGTMAILPRRKVTETWKEAFYRLCIDEAPEWIADRAKRYSDQVIENYHKITGHRDLPEVTPPAMPNLRHASWRKLTDILYDGDTMGSKIGAGWWLDPEFFRPGAGNWVDPVLLKQLRKLPTI